MNTARWNRIAGLLDRAVDLDRAGREALYARECADDPTIAREVEALVVADSNAQRFLVVEPPPAPTTRPQPAVGPGARVGGYELLRRIGAGGMGVVYEAQQERPRRRVALKLVQSAFADESTLRRFRYEAEALGRLRHPGIAQVYEAGVDASDGGERPFLAMEMVEGARTITAYARDERLSSDRVARLFLDVCAAVQHGHERGVLHRDVKPSNVLVDAAGAPKIIDFGVAKVLGDEGTRHTMAGELVGSLASMSPEQLAGDLDALDVRSDVYALGVLLYEMLCGAPPLDLRGLSVSQALVKARESTPPRPTSIRPDLPIELEWIVMRALEPDRERRYGSAADLARDLERYLGDEPVLAGPPSTAYRVSKFVRRNRLLVAATGAVLLAVVAGAVVAWIERGRAIEAKDRAEKAETLANERLARIEREARTNRELTDFQRSILTSADPDVSGRDARVVDSLARAGAALSARDGLDPLVELALRRSIAEAYGALGLPKETGEELARMRSLWEAQLAPADATRLELERLAVENDAYSKPASERLPRARDGLARARRTHGDDAAETAQWKLALAGTLLETGKLDESLELAQEAIPALAARHGDASSAVVDARIFVGRALNDARRLDEAERWKRATYELCVAAFGAEHDQTLRAKRTLANGIGMNGRPDEAVRMLLEVVEAHERRTGPQSARAISARLDLGEFLQRVGRRVEALEEFDRVLVDAAASIGDGHTYAFRARLRRAATLLSLGRREEARDELLSTHAKATRELGPDDPTTIEAQGQLARVLFLSARAAEALPHARAAWERSSRVLGEFAAQTLVRGSAYATVLGAVGRRDEAIAVYERVLAAQDASLGRSHRDSLQSIENLSTTQRLVDDLDGAACTALEYGERAAADGVPAVWRAGAHASRAQTCAARGEHEEAVAHYALAADAWSRSIEANPTTVIYAAVDQAYSLDVLLRPDEARAVLERASAAACASNVSPEAFARAFTSYASALRRAKDVERARDLARTVLARGDAISASVRAMAEELAQVE